MIFLYVIRNTDTIQRRASFGRCRAVGSRPMVLSASARDSRRTLQISHWLSSELLSSGFHQNYLASPLRLTADAAEVLSFPFFGLKKNQTVKPKPYYVRTQQPNPTVPDAETGFDGGASGHHRQPVTRNRHDFFFSSHTISSPPPHLTRQKTPETK